jgi:hypothetical protein
MATSYKVLRDKISPGRRAANEAAAKAMLAEMPIYALRDALKFTQAQLAEELGIKQPSLSKLERRPDHLVSTLRRFIEAMGGELELKAHFPSGSVSITELGDLDDQESDSGPHAAASR